MTWPRLTESLPTVVWGTCQGCGAHGTTESVQNKRRLLIWMEHDDGDKRQPLAVVLCEACSNATIAAHARLYEQETADVPCPGVMGLCSGCTHRTGYLCGHPDLTVNGGSGLAITHPKPAHALVNRGRKGGCGHMRIWTGPPTECAGRAE